MAAQYARDLGFQHIGDLASFDIGDLLAHGDGFALGDRPGGQRALFHGKAPFGNGNGVKGHFLATFLIASALRSTDGMYRSSSAGETGAGGGGDRKRVVW